MRAAFSGLPTREVVLRRDSGEVDGDGKPVAVEARIVLHPWRLGFPEYLDRVYPAPVIYKDMQPIPDPNRAAEHGSRRLYVLLAAAMRDQLDAKPPGDNADRAAWDAYALAVAAEFEAANFVEGDVVTLIQEATRVNRGAGKLGKA